MKFKLLGRFWLKEEGVRSASSLYTLPRLRRGGWDKPPQTLRSPTGTELKFMCMWSPTPAPGSTAEGTGARAGRAGPGAKELNTLQENTSEQPSQEDPGESGIQRWLHWLHTREKLDHKYSLTDCDAGPQTEEYNNFHLNFYFLCSGGDNYHLSKVNSAIYSKPESQHKRAEVLTHF